MSEGQQSSKIFQTLRKSLRTPVRRDNYLICPMCLKPLPHLEKDFALFCTQCAKVDASYKPTKAGCKPHAVSDPVCPEHKQRLEPKWAPFLMHLGCTCKNPILNEQGELAGLKDNLLEWETTTGTGEKEKVAHWSLVRVAQAAGKPAGVDARGMWFPAEMLAAVQPLNRRGMRVLLKGSRQVGKTVLAAVSVSDFAFEGSKPPVRVSNFAYASPFEQAGGEPWAIYGHVLKALESLRDYSPPQIDPTRGGQDRYSVYAGFYTGLFEADDEYTVVFYDIAGEKYAYQLDPLVDNLADASDVTYVVLDVSSLRALSSYQVNHLPSADTGSLKAALDSLDSNELGRTILVITKLDNIDLDKALSELRGRPAILGKAGEEAGRLVSAVEALAGIRDSTRSGMFADNTPVTPRRLAKESLAVLKDLLKLGNRQEQKLLELIGDRIDGTFFVWTEALRRDASTDADSSGPISYGVRHLVRYTLDPTGEKSKPRTGK